MMNVLFMIFHISKVRCLSLLMIFVTVMKFHHSDSIEIPRFASILEKLIDVVIIFTALGHDRVVKFRFCSDILPL